jgi:alkylation response protein AidB-like acyl-CoA dehydrogenase
MAERLSSSLLQALRDGDALLDRGIRGPASELALLSAAGLLAAPLPVSAGGRGWGTDAQGALPMLTVLNCLGGASLPVARIYEGHVNAVRLAVRHGSPAQRASMAKAVLAGGVMGVWGADSEQPVHLDPLPTGAVLRGVKAFASGLGDVTLAVVTVRTADGLQMALVDATDPARCDQSRWDMDAMVGSRSGYFDCDGLSIGTDQCLGRPDALFDEPDFHGGIWRLVACYSGAMQQIARELALLIEQRDLADDPIMRHRLGLVAMEAQSSMLWARAACINAETGADANLALSTVLFAREAIEQAAGRQIALADRIGGTSLHQRGSALGRIMRDLTLYLRQAQLDSKLAMAAGCWRAVADADTAGIH